MLTITEGDPVHNDDNIFFWELDVYDLTHPFTSVQIAKARASGAGLGGGVCAHHTLALHTRSTPPCPVHRMGHWRQSW